MNAKILENKEIRFKELENLIQLPDLYENPDQARAYL